MTSTSPLPTNLTVTANSGVDMTGTLRSWIKMALALNPADPTTCPVLGDPAYTPATQSLVLAPASPTALCITLDGMQQNSLYIGALTFATQSGSTIIQLQYRVTPGTIVLPSLPRLACGTNNLGAGLTCYHAQGIPISVVSQGNLLTFPDAPNPLTVNIQPVGPPAEPDWLTVSIPSITVSPTVPGTLTLGVNPARTKAPDVTLVELIGDQGASEYDFFLAVQPLAESFTEIFRPSGGTWWLNPPGQPPAVVGWGTSGDIPLVADYDDDGINDYAVWRPSTGQWWVFQSATSTPVIVGPWGQAGDIPVPADYDYDGKADFAVWRPSDGTWYIVPSANPGVPIVFPWGAMGDIPVPADYDGDGKIDFAVWRPSNGTWYIIPSANPSAPIVLSWGQPGDIPVPADYDGDGKTDFAIWRPSTGTWWVLPSGTPSVPIILPWGRTGDIPVPGDYDGDGKLNYTIWRPTTGEWWILSNTNPSSAIVREWGQAGDIPVSFGPVIPTVATGVYY